MFLMHMLQYTLFCVFLQLQYDFKSILYMKISQRHLLTLATLIMLQNLKKMISITAGKVIIGRPNVPHVISFERCSILHSYVDLITFRAHILSQNDFPVLWQKLLKLKSVFFIYKNPVKLAPLLKKASRNCSETHRSVNILLAHPLQPGFQLGSRMNTNCFK